MAWIACTGALVAACGGGGGGGGNPPPGGGGNDTVSDSITFERLPFQATLGNGLNANAPVEAPARQVSVEAIDAGNNTTVLASTTTNASGNYLLTVPASRSMFIRVRAEMVKTGASPIWNFSVRNNTNSDAVYALQGATFDSGTTNSTRNLLADSGWGTTSYVAERAAAPFAILDAVYRAKELILSATPNAVFPDLRLFWSANNRAATPFCPDNGNIGTSSYVVFPLPPRNLDGCNPQQPGVDGIYILGDFAGGSGDTDEFDSHVIAHEFGHYIEDRFARSDSIGGAHSRIDRLDLRVAFGEGWGNAFAGMSLADPVYRDSFSGVTRDGGFNMETDDTTVEGWFSESSIGELLWDFFDSASASEAVDTVALGFTPIYAVMTGAQSSTDAVTSIFSFASALRSANAPAAAGIDTLVGGEDVSVNDDEFGQEELNDGGAAGVLPIFSTAVRNGTPVSVCSRSPFGNTSSNKLGNRAFVLISNDATRPITITATGAPSGGGTIAATDPDIFVFRRGSLIAYGDSANPGSEMISQVELTAGTYVIEVYDFAVDGASATPRCMTVSIQG